MFLSLAMVSPISAPPHTLVQTAAGMLFSSRTLAMIFDMAILERGVLGAPFL